LAISGVLEETARAKVNLALHVMGRRPDGYHLLDSIVVFADIFDTLRFTPAAENSLRVTGPLSDGVGITGNLVLRAQEAMAQAFGKLIPKVAVTLDKQIPAAAGLGGGSADAAAALRALCRFAGLDPLSRAVREIALSLGADVPVCLHSRACRLRGIGETLEPLPGLSPSNVVLANPGVPVPTADVFAALKLSPGEAGYPPLELPFELSNSRNDLTPPAISVAPVIEEVLSALRALPGVKFVRMSGSGGTCFALFDDRPAAETAAADLATRQPDWWIKPAVLS
jgi:4-diphosphocytidyl-2-C-methyl-D-erythritol kinase